MGVEVSIKGNAVSLKGDEVSPKGDEVTDRRVGNYWNQLGGRADESGNGL